MIQVQASRGCSANGTNRSRPPSARTNDSTVRRMMLRVFDPLIADMPRLADNSFSRILRLEARYARFFWARYFAAVSQDLFAREKRKAEAPLNVALNYGYGFLYHAIEWQCLASGLDPTIGIVHKLRRQRPSLVCDLVEPFRCCVELTLVRHLHEMHEKKADCPSRA